MESIGLRFPPCGVPCLVVSEQVIIESDRVLGGRFPDLVEDSRRLWKNIAPEMVPTPSPQKVRRFAEKLPEEDAMILYAACEADVEAFVTWNTRDFMKSGISDLVPSPVVVPAGCLGLVREWIEPYLD